MPPVINSAMTGADLTCVQRTGHGQSTVTGGTLTTELSVADWYPQAMAKKSAKTATSKKTQAKRPTKAPASGKGTPQRRADFGVPVTTYFKSLPAGQQPIALAAHMALLKAAPTLQHTVKWGIAQYLFPGGSMKDAEGFAIYATSKSVNLAIGRGGELASQHALLEGTGKSMRHVKLYSVKEATSRAVQSIIADAVSLVNDG